jgi:predicted transposase YbfD/YdcC
LRLSACFTAWVREAWPDRPDFIAIDGKTSRRSHDRGAGRAPLHLVSALLKDRGRTDTRYYISSADLAAQAAAEAVRGHWGIENRLHWVLDVVFGDDQARLRTGHGAKNMAVVRHFAINLVRAAVSDKKSIKLRRKAAGWDVGYLAAILGLQPR